MAQRSTLQQHSMLRATLPGRRHDLLREVAALQRAIDAAAREADHDNTSSSVPLGAVAPVAPIAAQRSHGHQHHAHLSSAARAPSTASLLSLVSDTSTARCARVVHACVCVCSL